jgi:anti-sigma regulatory factor (Ser/Thr protein kinase)
VASHGSIDAAHGETGPATGLVHEALLYRDMDEYLAGTCEFLSEGLADGEPAMVAVPRDRIGPLRAALNGAARHVRFVDMTVMGRNPSRIIPFVREWADGHGGAPARFIGEPIWAGRRPAETVEAVRHEGLLNLAFAGSRVAILCPYDVSALDPGVLRDAERTHPVMVACGHRWASSAYEDPADVYAAHRHPLPPPPADADELPVSRALGRLRRFVRDRALRAGMGDGRVADLLLAVDEAAANTLVHGDGDGGVGVVRIWEQDQHVVCEVAGGGTIRDPLAGRRRPPLHAFGGRGLWLMNQLCDLVELRPGPPVATVRLHVRIGPSAAPAL